MPQDIGADLRAPELDDAGQPNWRYTLFKEAQPGDVVLHYDKSGGANGIVGSSLVAGPWRADQIIWGARGSYARDKGTKPHERPGFIVPLKGFQRLPIILTLDRIRARASEIGALKQLQNQSGALPLYFPFDLSEKRPCRLLQGYAFKLPSAFLRLFPELADCLRANGAHGVAAVAGTRNPPWSRDELILALDLYMTHSAAPPHKNSHDVAELSALLNRLAVCLGQSRGGDYRNPNGIYMKMMNFRRFDPAFISTGKVSLTRGNKDEEVVWKEFAHDRARLSGVAAAIRATIQSGDIEPILSYASDGDGEEAEAEEGRILTRLHRVRERSRQLVEQRKQQALAQLGRLVCEVCDFDFQERYGDRGLGYIEAHHTRPLHTLANGTKTKLQDLALVCANCHRMIHAASPWLSLEELRRLIRPQ